MADAVAQGASAQKISFEFQKKLAEISKYLFGLGVSNITANRMVVCGLEMKLNGASKQQISDLARQELLAVVKQLKDQEDLLVKQQRAAEALKDLDRRLGQIESTASGYAVAQAALQNRIDDAKEGLDRINQRLLKDIGKRNEMLGSLHDLKESFNAQEATLEDLSAMFRRHAEALEEIKARQTRMAEDQAGLTAMLEKLKGGAGWGLLRVLSQILITGIVIAAMKYGFKLI